MIERFMTCLANGAFGKLVDGGVSSNLIPKRPKRDVRESVLVESPDICGRDEAI